MTKTFTISPVQVALLTDLDQLQKIVDEALEKDLELGFDVETGYSGPDQIKGSLYHDWPNQFVCGFSISTDPKWGRYIPLKHDEGPNVDWDRAWTIMAPILTQGKVVAHNAKFELRAVRKAAGYDIASNGGTIFDTMLNAYVLSEFQQIHRSTDEEGVDVETSGVKNENALKDLVYQVYGYDQPHIETLFPEGMKKKDLDALRFNVLPLSAQVISYACDDAAWALRLHRDFTHRARTERKTIYDLEHEIMKMMADVEQYGVLIDWDALASDGALGDKFIDYIDSGVRKGFKKLAPQRDDIDDMNLGSWQQIQKLFYRDIGWTTTRLRPNPEKHPEWESWQAMATNKAALEALAQEHPEVRKLLELREVQNLVNRFHKWQKDYHYDPSGRVHASYNQVTVATGRFAANDPAIQQLPKTFKHTAYGTFDPEADDDTTSPDHGKWTALVSDPTKINGEDYWTGSFRDYCVAGPNHYLLTFDFSQVELRVLAGVSQEPALIEAFAKGIDVHAATAAQMLGKRVEDVTDKERQDYGKRMNFALLYQQGQKAMAEQLGVSLEKAGQMYKQYFSAFSRVGTWQSKAQAEGVKCGYSESWLGRKNTIWELTNDKKYIRAKGVRMLVNAPIQGGAADYMKVAMVKVFRELKRRDWWMTKCTVIMNQHDSLVFEVDNSIDPNELRAILEPLVTFHIPQFPNVDFVADWELGQRWYSSKKWKTGMVAVNDGDKWVLASPDSPPPAKEKVVKPAPEPKPAPQQAIATPRVLIVETKNEVTQEVFKNVLSFVKSKPGGSLVRFVCAQGQVDLGTSGVTTADAGRISLMVGGAKVYEQIGVDDLMEIMAGV